MLAQALALREAGYTCSRAVVYYAGSRTRIEVPVDEAGERDVRAAVAEARRIRTVAVAPPPLVDSPKCPRCSLVGIYLPDETRALNEPEAPMPRRLLPGRDDRLPAYVQAYGATVGLSGPSKYVPSSSGCVTRSMAPWSRPSKRRPRPLSREQSPTATLRRIHRGSRASRKRPRTPDGSHASAQTAHRFK